MKNYYDEKVDGVRFEGCYDIEEDDEGFPPIISLTELYIGNSPDLMLVIDSWVIQTIESRLQSK
jgi:hypothetical protein